MREEGGVEDKGRENAKEEERERQEGGEKLLFTYSIVYCSMQRSTDFLRTTRGAAGRG